MTNDEYAAEAEQAAYDARNNGKHTYETVVTIRPSETLKAEINRDGNVELFIQTIPANGKPLKELAEQATSDPVMQEALFIKMMQLLSKANTQDVIAQHIQ